MTNLTKHNKMNNYRGIITFGVIVVLIIVGYGCNFHKDFFIPSYIESYYFYDGIAVKRALASTSTKHLHLQSNWTSRVWYQSEGEEKDMYDKICRINGDTAYNRTERRPAGVKGPYNGADFPHYATINVISNKDFDTDHPAGVSLNDVMSIRYTSAKRYIESGYTQENMKQEEIYQPLDRLSPKELQYSIGNTFLVFDKEPDSLDIHTLTITVTNAAKESYTVQYKYDFSLPEGHIREVQ